LPPVEKSSEFDSLDSVADSEPYKQPIEMRLDGAASHVEALCDLIILTALKQQIRDLLLARTESNDIPSHVESPSFDRWSSSLAKSACREFEPNTT